VGEDKVFHLVDEAWLKRGRHTVGQTGNWEYTVDMGRTVGTAGETKIMIVVRPDSTDIVTSYPIN
jgi:hypothetical protein